ncbi:hypothetical protein F5Y00DRAFT_222163 [Daldinia vernicosa]|uniref:uncharacterized protein n=1 Tax=Daldinia vernicosa TaxID=114800 RepID=UPI002007AEA9|nr:uncharacterized protein F5Y00DRAFT_222163 [Daldinia vernicosa]KAI0854038.1 hypothetical protein F5Y00DRAFT_222163 [Daldinia vernicosa]
MRVNIVPEQTFLPLQSVTLGRLTTSYEHPHQNYHDPPASQPNILLSDRSTYAGEHLIGSGSNFGSTLTSLISARFSKQTKSKIRVTADHVKTYTLDNSDSWFEEATHLPATQSWVERAIDRGYDIYMIVGYHTITNARLSQESVAEKSVGAHIELPVSLSLAATGVVVPIGDIIDPIATLHQQGLDRAQSQFVTSGEQVCAIEYRKVRYQWLSSKRIEKSRLSNVRQWPSRERARDEEDGEDDIIDVDLTEVQDLDGDWDTETVDNKILFIRSFDK